MTDKSEIEKLLEDAVSQDKKVAPEAQRKFVKIVSSLMRLDKENASGAEQLLYQKILLSLQQFYQNR